MYKNIIVAMDDTIYSKAALLEVSNRIKRHGGKIRLVHAVFFNEEEFANAPDQLDCRLKLGRDICNEAKGMVRSEFDLEIDALVCQGEPPDVLADISRKNHADLIALGTFGRKGFKRLFMGSVTAGVIMQSECDVLVVKKPCDECNGEYLSILVSFDGSEASQKVLGRVCELSRENAAEVTVLYVIPHYEELIGFFKTDTIKQNLLAEAEKILDKAVSLAAAQSVQILTVIAEGQAAAKIIETAENRKHDLIAMGSFGWRGMDRALMGSATERVIAKASCPVLVVKQEDSENSCRPLRFPSPHNLH